MIPRILACCLIATLLGSVFSASSAAVEIKPLAIGSAAPDFDLPGVDGKQHQLADYAAAKVLVVVFTSNHCPTAQAYEGRIKKLAADYRDKGVALVAINPNDPLAIRLDELGYTDVSDSFDDMKLRAKDHGFEFPYLYDGDTQKIAHAFGVLATPHVFIFDAERKLRYIGRIDNSDVKEVKTHEAADAIDALLAGKPVAVEKTKIFGCSTKWSDKREDVKKFMAACDAEPVTLDPVDITGVKALVANTDADKKLRLINVWATYCGPCIVELPELVEINRMYRHRPFEMVTISEDDDEHKDAALKMLKERHVAMKNLIYSAGDHDALVNAIDKDWDGPEPFTALVAPGGKIIYHHTGPIDPLELKRAIVEYLGRTYASR